MGEEDTHTQTLVATRRAKAKARGGIEECFQLRLLVPGSLECAWKHPIDSGEHVQCIRNVQLRNTRTGALHSMLAVRLVGWLSRVCVYHHHSTVIFLLI